MKFRNYILLARDSIDLVPEVKKVVKEMFDMMAAISPEHFAIIDGTIDYGGARAPVVSIRDTRCSADS